MLQSNAAGEVALAFLEQLEQRHSDVLDQLDLLNSKIEVVLQKYGKAPVVQTDSMRVQVDPSVES